jgi:hypothetical protein
VDPEHRTLTSEELVVLEIALRAVADSNLPVQRCTEADGPNERQLTQWSIPATLQSMGSVPVVDLEDACQTEHIKFRRPRISDGSADVILEMPLETKYCSLRFAPTDGWTLC